MKRIHRYESSLINEADCECPIVPTPNPPPPQPHKMQWNDTSSADDYGAHDDDDDDDDDHNILKLLLFLRVLIQANACKYFTRVGEPFLVAIGDTTSRLMHLFNGRIIKETSFRDFRLLLKVSQCVFNVLVSIFHRGQVAVFFKKTLC